MKKSFAVLGFVLLVLGVNASAADKVTNDALVVQARELSRARLSHRLQPVTREQFGLPPVTVKKEGK